ncbi:MAG: NAD(+) diphosphatase [Ilumatobacteraceae bacterium]
MTEFVPHHVPPADLDPRRGRYLHVIGTAVWEIDEPLDAAWAVHYLGHRGTDALWAVDVPPAVDPADGAALDLRRLYGRVDDTDWAIAGRAVQIVEWARTHRFCGRCGTPTELSGNDRSMTCPSCGLLAYPRLAPAIITLITRHDGEEALLARGAQFPVPMYSCLAGFVEPGESLEQAVHREVREEVGIEISDVTYAGSQPWPFPHSLMLGFTAEHASGELVCDPVEILDAQWYRRDQLPMIPPGISIARKLIDAWVSR